MLDKDCHAKTETLEREAGICPEGGSGTSKLTLKPLRERAQWAGLLVAPNPQLHVFAFSRTSCMCCRFSGSRQHRGMKTLFFLLLLFEGLGMCALAICGEVVERLGEGMHASSVLSTGCVLHNTGFPYQ